MQGKACTAESVGRGGTARREEPALIFSLEPALHLLMSLLAASFHGCHSTQGAGCSASVEIHSPIPLFSLFHSWFPKVRRPHSQPWLLFPHCSESKNCRTSYVPFLTARPTQSHPACSRSTEWSALSSSTTSTIE